MWCATSGLGPVSQVFRRAAVEFASLIGRGDNPASDALLDRHVPCRARGREAGSEAHQGRFFWDRGPGIQLAIRLGKAGWLVRQAR